MLGECSAWTRRTSPGCVRPAWWAGDDHPPPARQPAQPCVRGGRMRCRCNSASHQANMSSVSMQVGEPGLPDLDRAQQRRRGMRAREGEVRELPGTADQRVERGGAQPVAPRDRLPHLRLAPA